MENKETRRIVGVAIKSKETGEFWSKEAPYRHSNLIHELASKSIDCGFCDAIQGFVLDSGEFVDRYDAGEIAFANGQTKEHHYRLTSEHLW